MPDKKKQTRAGVKDPVFARNPLTDEQAARLAQSIAFDLQGEADALARVLLFCHSITFETDQTKREGLLNAIEKEAAPFITEIDDALLAVMRREFEALKSKGGA